MPIIGGPDSGRPTLLVVHHTPSPSLAALVAGARNGCADPGLAPVEVRFEPALSATAFDVLGSGAVLLITPANIGYMSGALKHFFDTIYYPCLGATDALPWGLVVHGNDDTSGAVRSVSKIAGALRWRQAVAPLSVLGGVSSRDAAAAGERAAALAASLLPGAGRLVEP